jgi:hypothetical protein
MVNLSETSTPWRARATESFPEVAPSKANFGLTYTHNPRSNPIQG